jgi:hypothetical protein
MDFLPDDHSKADSGQKNFEARLPCREAARFKGLPNEQARFDLARTYLETQSARWPELRASGVIPKANQTSLRQMSDEFERRYMGKEVETHIEIDLGGTIALGVAYARYSSENSNPRSLDQQLKLILECAAKHKVFIPWSWVFADAGVTGRTARRRGYQLAKEELKKPNSRASFLVFDELGRISRDAIEALQLGRLIELNRKRMLGASDAFDSNTPYASMMLHQSSMFHQQFVDNLKTCRRRSKRNARGGGRVKR